MAVLVSMVRNSPQYLKAPDETAIMDDRKNKTS